MSANCCLSEGPVAGAWSMWLYVCMSAFQSAFMMLCLIANGHLLTERTLTLTDGTNTYTYWRNGHLHLLTERTLTLTGGTDTYTYWKKGHLTYWRNGHLHLLTERTLTLTDGTDTYTCWKNGHLHLLAERTLTLTGGTDTYTCWKNGHLHLPTERNLHLLKERTLTLTDRTDTYTYWRNGHLHLLKNGHLHLLKERTLKLTDGTDTYTYWKNGHLVTERTFTDLTETYWQNGNLLTGRTLTDIHTDHVLHWKYLCYCVGLWFLNKVWIPPKVPVNEQRPCCIFWKSHILIRQPAVLTEFYHKFPQFLRWSAAIISLPTGTLRLPWLRFFRAFSSVVRQMPGYTSQRRGTVRILPN